MLKKLKAIFQKFIDRIKSVFNKRPTAGEKEVDFFEFIFYKDGKKIENFYTNAETEFQLKNYTTLLKYTTAYTVETVYQLHERKVLIYVKSVKNDIKEVSEND